MTVAARIDSPVVGTAAVDMDWRELFRDPEVRNAAIECAAWLGSAAMGALTLWERIRRVRRRDRMARIQTRAADREVCIDDRRQALDESKFLKELLLDLRDELNRYRTAAADARAEAAAAEQRAADSEEQNMALHERIDTLLTAIDHANERHAHRAALAAVPKAEDADAHEPTIRQSSDTQEVRAWFGDDGDGA